MQHNAAFARPDTSAPAQSTIVYRDGSRRVINHSNEVFHEEKKKGSPTFADKMHSLAIAYGTARNISTVQGDSVIYAEAFGKPIAHAEQEDIPATVNGLNAKQLRKKHRKEPLQVYARIES